MCKNLHNDPYNCAMCGHVCKLVLGIPVSCIAGVCLGDPIDLGIPHD
jgi:hypothetical protein